MATLTPSPKMQFLDANGNPLAGGKLYTYASGTTTPLASYTDATGGTPNTNPVILDSAGYASVWLGTSLYTLKLTTSADALVWTADGIGGVATLSALAASGGSALVGYTQGGTGAVATTAQTKLRERVSINDFGGGSAKTAAANASAVASAIAAGARHIYLPDASYAMDSLEINVNGVILEGNGLYTTVITASAVAADLLSVGSTANVSSFTLKNIEIVGNATRTGGVTLGSASFYAVVVTFDNAYINGFTGVGAYGIQFRNTWWVNITNQSDISGNYNNLYIPAAGVVTTLEIDGNSRIRSSTNIGLHSVATGIGSVDKVILRHCSFEFSAKEAILSTSPRTTWIFDNTYFESNSTSGTGTISITSSDAAAYRFAMVHANEVAFHTTTTGSEFVLGYCQKSTIQNCNGIVAITTAATTECMFRNNRGSGVVDMLTLYKTLLGSIQAEEYDAATGYWTRYSSIFQRFDGDEIRKESHLRMQQTTKPTIAVTAAAGSTASASVTNGSTDTQGQVSIVISGAGISAGTVATVTFNRTYITAPLGVVICSGAYKGLANIPVPFAQVGTATTFTIGFQDTPTAGTYTFNYIVIGNA